MKKGISLIVLVITIIVMIILAAAIIISISNSNVINKATQAVLDTNIATIKEAAALKFADLTLAIKEAGDESILGGKTVGEYIEQELINDGTMKESDAVIFTPKGGVYGANEYNSIPDKDETRDWRYIGGKLYYFGTDIAKRKALKENPNVNTDYMYIYSDMVGSNGCRLSEIGYLNKVSSFVHINEFDVNTGINSSAVGPTDDVLLTNGMKLTLKETYNGQPMVVQTLIYGDLDSDGLYISGADDMYLYMLVDRLSDPEAGVSIEEIYNTYPIINETLAQFTFIMNVTCDGDLDGDWDLADANIISFMCSMFALEETFGSGKSLSETSTYNSYSSNFKETLNNQINIYKKIYRFPADIAK